MTEEIRNEINEEALEQVTGGKSVTIGFPAQYDTPEEVVFVFEIGSFARVEGLAKRTKILSHEAALCEATGKYGARCTCKDNAGKEEQYWEYELTRTIL